MSDVKEDANPDEGVRGATVTGLPEAGRRVESTPPSGETDGGGGFWKLSTFVLLAALIVSGGFNMLQLGARGDLETEAAQSADLLANETARADQAEQTANSLRELVGDVHTNMTALQASLTAMLASTSAVVSPGEESSAAAPEAADSPFDAAFEAAGNAFGAVSDAASDGAEAVAEAAASVFEQSPEPPESALPEIAVPAAALPEGIESEVGVPELRLPEQPLPDVSAPMVDAEAGAQAAEPEATPSAAWTRARDWFTSLFDRAE